MDEQDSVRIQEGQVGKVTLEAVPSAEAWRRTYEKTFRELTDMRERAEKAEAKGMKWMDRAVASGNEVSDLKAELARVPAKLREAFVACMRWIANYPSQDGSSWFPLPDQAHAEAVRRFPNGVQEQRVEVCMTPSAVAKREREAFMQAMLWVHRYSYGGDSLAEQLKQAASEAALRYPEPAPVPLGWKDYSATSSIPTAPVDLSDRTRLHPVEDKPAEPDGWKERSAAAGWGHKPAEEEDIVRLFDGEWTREQYDDLRTLAGRIEERCKKTSVHVTAHIDLVARVAKLEKAHDGLCDHLQKRMGNIDDAKLEKERGA